MSHPDPPQPAWGWRLRCAEPCCDATLTSWLEPHLDSFGGTVTGPPPLHPAFAGAEGSGWWLASRPRRKHKIVWRAYCPAHSGPVWAWVKAVSDWQVARREHGRKHRQGAYGLANATIDYVRRVVGLRVREWEDDNPRPPPPWEQP